MSDHAPKDNEVSELKVRVDALERIIEYLIRHMAFRGIMEREAMDRLMNAAEDHCDLADVAKRLHELHERALPFDGPTPDRKQA